MTLRTMRAVSVVAFLGIGAIPIESNAHHAVSAHFDESQTLTLQGIVVDFKLRSPHATFVLDGALIDDAGRQIGDIQTWEIESISAPGLRRLGIDPDTFQRGDGITVVGSPHRNPEYLYLHSDWFIDTNDRVYRNEIMAGQRVQVDPDASAKEARANRIDGRWRASLLSIANSSPLPLNEQGQAAWDQYDPKLSPANTCEPVNIPAVFLGPYLFDVEISGTEITLHNQLYDVVRRLPTDSTAVRSDPDGIFGSMTARFSGDALVVESSEFPPSRWGLAFATSVLGGGADLPSSVQKSVTETYSVSDDGQTLNVDYRIVDPVYLLEPYEGRVSLSRVADDAPMYPFECDLESASMFSRDLGENPLEIERE